MAMRFGERPERMTRYQRRMAGRPASPAVNTGPVGRPPETFPTPGEDPVSPAFPLPGEDPLTDGTGGPGMPAPASAIPRPQGPAGPYGGFFPPKPPMGPGGTGVFTGKPGRVFPPPGNAGPYGGIMGGQGGRIDMRRLGQMRRLSQMDRASTPFDPVKAPDDRPAGVIDRRPMTRPRPMGVQSQDDPYYEF